MTMEVEFGDREVVKRATTAAEREALRREARVLAAAAHPGVVRLIGATDDTLVLERVEGGCLTGLPAQPQQVTVTWAAAVATTLADLHDTGWAHGAVTPDHVLFDGGGRPVLCSFGRAAGITPELRRADVASLAGLIADRLPAGADRRLHRALRGSPHDARSLARLLVRYAAPPKRTYVGRRRVVAASVALATVAGVAAATVAAEASGPAPKSLRSRSLRLGNYSLSFPASEMDVAVVGRWGCADWRVAVLDRAGGWIWVFDKFPQPAARLSARLIGRVPGASGIARVSAAGMCDRIGVTRRGRPPVVVQVRP
jgi:hypothetical protein